jgi:hypothetical protein
MPQKKGLDLNRVVLLGRTFEEYVRIFELNPQGARGKNVLDVAGGVSSFSAEANEHGIKAMAFDRIYTMGHKEIQSRCEHDLEEITRDIGDREVYRWDFYRSPEGMRHFRKLAYQKFLADFAAHPEHYVAGSLPNTPFQDLQFDLTLASYLLFVYEDQFTFEFHKESLRELMRVTRGEIRMYPTVTFEAEPSKYLARLRNDPEFVGWNFSEVETDFEFLRNSNRFVKITRK